MSESLLLGSVLRITVVVGELVSESLITMFWSMTTVKVVSSSPEIE